jgi:hypothetical protein
MVCLEWVPGFIWCLVFGSCCLTYLFTADPYFRVQLSFSLDFLVFRGVSSVALYLLYPSGTFIFISSFLFLCD